MPNWTFITNYGLVLSHISIHSSSTAIEIAMAVGVTERAVRRIIADLDAEGYITVGKKGRNNIYKVNPHHSLRHESVQEVPVGDLLVALGWKRRGRRKGARAAPALPKSPAPSGRPSAVQ